MRKHLTFANIAAGAALFISLGGGAYAISNKAAPDSVNSKAIIDGSVKSADVKDKLAAVDVQARGGTPQQLGALLASETKRWGEVIARAGIPKQ